MTDNNLIEEHEALDTILKYLIDNKSENPIHSHTIWQQVYPDIEEDMVYFMLRKLIGQEVITSHVRDSDLDSFQVFFEANSVTKHFLFHNGGFTKLHEKKQSEQKRQLEIDILEREKLESEVDIIRFQKGLGKKLTIWGFIIAILSVIASVLTTLIQNQPNESLTRQIESVTQRADSLENNLKSTRLQLQSIELKLAADTIK